MPTDGPNFAGLRVAGFESRRGAEMAAMVTRFGGVPSISPSLREVAPAKNPEAVDFASRLMTGQIDVVIHLTGVGVRLLMEQLHRQVDRQRFLEALSDVVTIARGPKPTAALRELGITPTHRTAEPNTWREVLAIVDRDVPVVNQTVGLIEYGQPNASLLAGLEARGAMVQSLKVYRWELPEDIGPLEENVRAIVDGRIDVALFTSSPQAMHLMQVAGRMGLAERVRGGLQRAVVASIGPDTSETLRQHSLPVDLEPQHAAMGHLIAAAASQSGELLARKRNGPPRHEGHEDGKDQNLPAATAPIAAPPDSLNQPWRDGLFMRACRREPTERTPIWLMRQMGRYLPEYRAVREKMSFLELCENSSLCAELMIATVRRLGVDAAIIFADLLPILQPMGFDLEYSRGDGPVIHNPVREAGDLDRVAELEEIGPLEYVMETVRQTRAGLPIQIPLIGFAGAPFTLASYAIEGGSSRSFLHTKKLMYGDSGAWDALMERLARAVARYLTAQIAAGTGAVQLFDSWVGCLGPDDYRRFVLPYTKRLIESLPNDAPVIHFATGNPALLPLLSEAGGQVIGVDWRIDLDEAWRLVGPERAVQGNLDPAALLADPREIRRRAEVILHQAGGRPGHIFNLGHGVLPQTPPEHAIALVEAVHAWRAKA